MSNRLFRVNDIEKCFTVFNHIPDKILDVGFGNGFITNYFHSKGFDVIGIEINKKFINECSLRFPNIKFLLYNGKHFPFNDKLFSTILFNDVFEHISYDNIDEIMLEAKRVIRDDGIIYVSVMNRFQIIEPHKKVPFLTWIPKFMWNFVCKKIKGEEYINYYPYTENRMKKLFEKHELLYKNMTYIYIDNKFSGFNPINNKFIFIIFKIMKRLHLLSMLSKIAIKFSVLLYIAYLNE